ncbi:hypothetical protein NQ176_g4645 [Zarea fungicola]|uniref:Uncharacterized protein n=1 Tax=Zarea fungicola TaxID=93591 RepID=A0ACC1NCE2_9HYPO|nr:hypothetical protein NQ176_g4645 [Lecanicillium fungicola]
MPNYEVSASLALSEEQRDAIAELLTSTHSELNGIPSLFISVKFLDTKWTYIGGKKVGVRAVGIAPSPDERQPMLTWTKTPTNVIMGHFRQGSSRTEEQYAIMADRIVRGWNRIVGFNPDVDGFDSEKMLDSVLFLSTINAGVEQGYHLPPSGQDLQWFKDNVNSYKQKADTGSWRFKRLVEELQAKGIVPN